MTQSKHTPGPWRWYDAWDNGDNVYHAARMGSAGSTVLDAYPADIVIHGEANARLIAAAPDLLAALVQLLESEEDSYIFREIARDAIAKATGNEM